MDIKAKVNELVEKIQKNPQLLERFRKEPVKVVEELLGVDLPDDQINQLVNLVKAKIDLDKVGNLLGGLFGKKWSGLTAPFLLFTDRCPGTGGCTGACKYRPAPSVLRGYPAR